MELRSLEVTLLYCVLPLEHQEPTVPLCDPWMQWIGLEIKSEFQLDT